MLLRTPSDLAVGCISDLTFDAWRAGELDARRTAPLTQHLTDCATCAARRRSLDADAQAYARRFDFVQPRDRVRATLARRRRPRFGVLAASAAAMMALVALGLGLQPSAELRSKGGGSIGFYVLRGAELFRGESGQRVRPGDRLRFLWRSDREVYLAVLSLDAKGVASTYYPRPGAQRPLVPTGAEIELPLAVELDETLGLEEVFAVSCAEAPDVERMRASLAEHGDPRMPSDCRLQRLQLYKERAP